MEWVEGEVAWVLVVAGEAAEGRKEEAAVVATGVAAAVRQATSATVMNEIKRGKQRIDPHDTQQNVRSALKESRVV